VAAKHLASGFTLSLEQALTDTGTVGRVSYRLARGLSAQLSAGTVSGLALVWRAFSRD
jgi:translocation and assembly module TamB